VCNLENLKNEEAMTRVGTQRHKKKKIFAKLLHVSALFAGQFQGTDTKMSYQTHNNETGHNKHSHVVAFINQDFKGFG
jgi:hypothetical protein